MINSLEMETLQNIKKTKTYEERKDYSLKNPEDKQHNDFTDLIDDFIKVSLHMKFISDIKLNSCLLYTSPSPRDGLLSRMPSSA